MEKPAGIKLPPAFPRTLEIETTDFHIPSAPAATAKLTQNQIPKGPSPVRPTFAPFRLILRLEKATVRAAVTFCIPIIPSERRVRAGWRIKPMNRKQFFKKTGAAGVAVASGATGKCAGAIARLPPVRMKLGNQSAPTIDTHFAYPARYGVCNICGYPQIEGDRLYATVDELKRMTDLAGKCGIGVDCTAPRFSRLLDSLRRFRDLLSA